MLSDKIRIVHLIPSFERAGAETIVANICNFLPAADYEIHIVVLENSTAGMVRIDPSRNIRLHVAAGFPFRIKNKLPGFNINGFLKLRRILKEINPDIIHSHLFESSLALNLWLISFGGTFRFVHTAHTNSEHYKSRSFLNKFGLSVEKFAIRRINARFVCVSQDMFNSMKKHYRAEQLEIARNSIDTEYFRKDLVEKANLESLGISKDSFILIHTGRFAEVKNHPLMFRAMELLRQRNRKIVLLCLGFRGGLWEEYQAYINERDLGSYIYFLGEVDDPRPWLAAADLGLLPSFHEGLSLALLEMFSMGLPVLISKIPSSEEVVSEVTGRLFIDVNDAVLLADKIEEAMLHYDEFLETGRRMRQVVIDSFSVQQLAESYDMIYKQLSDRKI